ncbi:MAG TPA: hypothetical protein VK776_14225 [Bryobacteraceae bacterium]|jgi:hypothetical protein|nr:hypothetical protein [Bryobacteraceae bacterium]
MSTFVVNFAKTTLVFTAIVTLAPGAYPSTISTFSISTDAQGGTPCSMSGSGPGTASCSSVGDNFNHAQSSVTLTDNSIQLSLSDHMAASADGFASITHDDFYSVPVNGPVSAVVTLVCDNGSHIGSPGITGHFSLGSTAVSPPVETIYMGASQGSGPCGNQYVLSTLPPGFTFPAIFTVSLSAINNIVQLQTYIDASGSEVDDAGGIFVQLTVNRFLDANGNPIQATLLPEPGTLGTFALPLLLGAGVKWARSKNRISRITPSV